MAWACGRGHPGHSEPLRPEEISGAVGHKSTHITETVYRHVIVPAIRGGATVNLVWDLASVNVR